MSAEFAIALPAVLGCLALCIGAIGATAQYASLAGSAAVAARLAGRGDDAAATGVPPGTTWDIERTEGLTCVRMSAPDDTVLGRIGIRLSARACALDETVAR